MDEESNLGLIGLPVTQNRTSFSSRRHEARLSQEDVHAVSDTNDGMLDDSIDNRGDSGKTPSSSSLPTAIESTKDPVSQNPGAESRSTGYRKLIRNLRPTFPHLQNVQDVRWRRGGVIVEYYESRGGVLESKRIFSGSGNSQTFLTEQDENLQDVLLAPPDLGCESRLIVATDLTPDLICCLGSCLSINPEVFEEHLLGSGWRRKVGERDRDTDAGTWSTRGIDKDYVSIRWYRPVDQVTTYGFSLFDRNEIVEKGSLDWSEQTPPSRNYEDYEYFYTKNIVRRNWVLLPEDTIALNQQSAWEERATIWSKSDGESSTVLMLLDPLPEIDGNGSARELESARGNPKPKGPFATEPRISENGKRLKVRDRAQSKIGIDLPAFVFRPHVYRGPPIKYDSLLSESILPTLKTTLQGNKSTAATLQDFLDYNERPGQRNHRLNDSPMSCLFSMILDDTNDLLDSMNSALTRLASEVLDDTKIQDNIVDWRRSLQRFERELMELQTSLKSIEAYHTRMLVSGVYGKIKENGSTKGKLQQCLEEISVLRERSRKASKSIMTSISIVESKRGIAEAEIVTKLTELAFLFIPLTFSASLFSMQVRELSSELSIWVFFVVAGSIMLGLYTLRLIIRSPSFMESRNQMIHEVRLLSHILPGAHTPTRAYLRWLPRKCISLTQRSGQTISMFSRRHVLWVVSFLLCIFTSLILLAVIWTRPLEKGLKVVMTICGCLLCGSLILYMVVSRS